MNKKYNAFRKNGTQQDRDISLIMNTPNIQIPFFSFYPIPNLEPTKQPEPILFCQCVWGESRGEVNEGIRMVGAVIMNRYHSQSYFGITIHDVITKHDPVSKIYQFSCMNPKDVNYKKMRKPDAYSWIKVCKIVLPLYFSFENDYPKDIFHFVGKHLDPLPGWAKHMDQIEIGNHLFLRDKESYV